MSIGESPYSDGFYTHGSGYEWEAAFRQAFEDDPNIDKITFDCESGGFFCWADSLDLNHRKTNIALCGIVRTGLVRWSINAGICNQSVLVMKFPQATEE